MDRRRRTPTPYADSPKRRTIADRLAATREARFIGRRMELDLFQSAIAGSRPPFTVLHLHGPGGVGKTILLHAFARIARDGGRPVITLDGRDIRPSRHAFLSALVEALGRADDDPRGWIVPGRSVLTPCPA